MNRVIGYVLSAAAGICALAVPAHADGVRWSGDVDDTATVYIRQRDVRVDANKKGVSNQFCDFRGFLPRHDGRVWLRDARGRDEVRLVQQPCAENGYTAAVRICDWEPGRSHYEFTLQWDGDHYRDPRPREDDGDRYRDPRPRGDDGGRW